MPNRLTHEEFVKRAYQANPDLEIFGQYNGNKTKIHVRCSKCHQEYDVVPSSVMRGIGCPYCSGKLPIIGINDLATLYPEIAAQWDYNHNKNIKPSDLRPNSNKKISWQCDKCGGVWEAPPSARIRGRGCPYCSGNKVLVGFNDLASKTPDLLSEWNFSKNTDIKPTDVTAGSTRAVWWKCEHGHEWAASIQSRVKGAGCPYCAGLLVIPGETDLATRHPNIAAKWDYEKNADLIPQMVMPGSKKVVWWHCECGHVFDRSINSMVKNDSCPICSGRRVLTGFNDLATVNPQLASEWHPTKNGNLHPTDITAHSAKQVWWSCDNGHSWEQSVNTRSQGNGCPYCSNQKVLQGYNDLATTHPQIASEWCYNRNDGVTPRDVTHGSEKVVWWKCPICGCEYPASVASRTNTHSSKKCPQCSSQHGTSFREQCVLFYMRQALNCPVESRAQVKMCEQHKEIDIWIPSLMIGLEYDGEYYHENAIRDRNDSGKDNLAKSSGIRLIRIIESDHKEFNGDRVTYDVHHDRTKNLQEAIEHAINLIVPYQNAIDINADTSLIMQQYKNDEGERSLTRRYPELAEEWDIELNNGLTPDKVSYGSGYNAWWRCCHGHAYQSTVNNRTHLNSGCPYCSNKKVLTGFNDLATRFPSIAEEWHPTKNDGKHTPETIVFGSHLKVWWKCKTCGNEWETTISDRTHGAGCPVCAGRDIKQGYNDFATNFPEIAAEWHPTRNENLQPSDVTSHSHRKVWWVDKFGHEWEATIANRTNGNGCPYCSNRKILSGYNDLATIAPEVAREWHPTKNGELTPDTVFPKSGKKRFWKCSKCGTEYENIVSNITNGLSGCPNCRYKPGKQTKTI